MGWFELLAGLVKFVGWLAKYLGDRQLIEAGVAKAVAEGSQATLRSVEEAKRAREALDDPASPLARGVRDKFTRPDG